MGSTSSSSATGPPSRWRRIGSAVFYALASIAIIFVNKIALTNYRFPSFLVLGMGQMLATIAVLFLARLLGLVSFPSLSREVPRRIFPLPLLYVLNLVAGLGSTQRLSLPMFTVLRRFSIAMTLGLEWAILGVTASFAVHAAVALMILGAAIAALNDLAFDALGYSLILANDACTAANGVYTKQKLDAKELGKHGLLYYNALFMLPPALLIAHWSGEVEQAFLYRGWADPGFLACFFLSCVCGFILNYSIVLCTHYNSALTTTCVGPIKNLVVTYVGMIVSGDYVFSWLNFIGINVSVFGSLLYTYVVFRTQASSPVKKAEANSGKSTIVALQPDKIPLI